MTRQLLAFARKGKLQKISVDMQRIIREVEQLLARGVDKRIEIELDLQADASTVDGDPTQLQSALLNIGINARDAMPEEGRLTFSTRNRWLDADFCKKHSYEGKPGKYLEISVADTGVGMEPSVLRRIFEPFFTTKTKGTGLGMAIARRIVEAHGGQIGVGSGSGSGAEILIVLPRENP